MGNATSSKRTGVLRGYAAAVVATVAALLLRLALTPWMGTEAPYLSFSPAVLLVAWRWGLGPGLCSLALGFVAGDYFLTPPFHGFGPYTREEAALVLDYAIGGVTGVVLLHLLHRSRARSAALATEKEREAAQRRRAEEQLQSANFELANHAAQLEKRVAERTAEWQRVAGDLQELLYSIAHNLQAPNRAMSGFAQILETEHSAQLDGEARELLQRISTAADQSAALINGVLELGHWSNTPLRFGLVQLRTVAEHARDMLGKDGRRCEVAEQWPEVVTDEKAVTTLLRQLLSNAVKFSASRQEPRVRVWAEEQAGNWSLHVEDNGIGIAEEQIPRIFRAMETLHSPRQYPGFGVGLAVVKRIAERLHGQITVTSRVGEGSHFAITFPRRGAAEK